VIVPFDQYIHVIEPVINHHFKPYFPRDLWISVQRELLLQLSSRGSEWRTILVNCIEQDYKRAILVKARQRIKYHLEVWPKGIRLARQDGSTFWVHLMEKPLECVFRQR